MELWSRVSHRHKSFSYKLKRLLNITIDVKFALWIKNIHFGFYTYTDCVTVSNVYSVLSPSHVEKNITGMLLGWDSNPRPLEQCLTNYTTKIVHVARGSSMMFWQRVCVFQIPSSNIHSIGRYVLLFYYMYTQSSLPIVFVDYKTTFY